MKRNGWRRSVAAAVVLSFLLSGMAPVFASADTDDNLLVPEVLSEEGEAASLQLVEELDETAVVLENTPADLAGDLFEDSDVPGVGQETGTDPDDILEDGQETGTGSGGEIVSAEDAAANAAADPDEGPDDVLEDGQGTEMDPGEEIISAADAVTDPASDAGDVLEDDPETGADPGEEIEPAADTDLETDLDAGLEEDPAGADDADTGLDEDPDAGPDEDTGVIAEDDPYADLQDGFLMEDSAGDELSAEDTGNEIDTGNAGDIADEIDDAAADTGLPEDALAQDLTLEEADMEDAAVLDAFSEDAAVSDLSGETAESELPEVSDEVEDAQLVTAAEPGEELPTGDGWKLTGTGNELTLTIRAGGVCSRINEITDEFRPRVAALILGKNVTGVADGAFDGYTGLASVKIQAALTQIGANAFRGCTSLKNITIPETVTSINNTAFSGCGNLVITGVLGSEAERFAQAALFTFVANPKVSIADARVQNIKKKIYTGEAKEQNPVVIVQLATGSRTLKVGTEYTLSYKNNTNAGTASVIIKGVGNFTGSVTRTFIIKPVSLKDADVSKVIHKIYTGSAFKPSPKVTLDGKRLKKDRDYKLSYQNNVKPGTAKVIVTGKGNYTGTTSTTFNIYAGEMKNTKISGIKNKIYTGKAITQKLKIKFKGKLLKKGKDYTVSYSNNVNKGKAIITIKGKGKYIGTVRRKFKIKARSVADAAITGLKNRIYNGAAHTQKPVVRVNKRTLEKGTDYTVSYENNINAGTATVIIKGIGNYKGTASAQFTIEKKSLKGASVSGIEDHDYTGEAITQSLTVQLKGKHLVHGTDYKVTYKNNKNAGTARLTIRGIGNYKGKITRTFTIRPISMQGGYIPSLSDIEYTGKALKPSIRVLVNGRTLKETTEYTVTYSNNVNVGTATITVTGKKNYYGTLSQTFRIVAASLTDAQVSGISDREYTGTARLQSVVVMLRGERLREGTDYTLSYSNNVDVGIATVQIVGRGNYTGSISRTFTITPPVTAMGTMKIIRVDGQRVASVQWVPRSSGISGYILQYGFDSNFSGGAQLMFSSSATSTQITNISGKSFLYCRVRTYKSVNGTSYYSNWSSTKVLRL